MVAKLEKVKNIIEDRILQATMISNSLKTVKHFDDVEDKLTNNSKQRVSYQALKLFHRLPKLKREEEMEREDTKANDDPNDLSEDEIDKPNDESGKSKKAKDYS